MRDSHAELMQSMRLRAINNRGPSQDFAQLFFNKTPYACLLPQPATQLRGVFPEPPILFMANVEDVMQVGNQKGDILCRRRIYASIAEKFKDRRKLRLETG
jgi:hypothetical protein